MDLRQPHDHSWATQRSPVDVLHECCLQVPSQQRLSLLLDIHALISETKLCDLARLLEQGFRTKNRKNTGFGLSQRIGQNEPKNRKMSPKLHFRAIFGSFFVLRLSFSYLPGEARTSIFPIFSLFRAEARKPRSSRRAGSQTKLSTKFGPPTPTLQAGVKCGKQWKFSTKSSKPPLSPPTPPPW